MEKCRSLAHTCISVERSCYCFGRTPVPARPPHSERVSHATAASRHRVARLVTMKQSRDPSIGACLMITSSRSDPAGRRLWAVLPIKVDRHWLNKQSEKMFPYGRVVAWELLLLAAACYVVCLTISEPYTVIEFLNPGPEINPSLQQFQDAWKASCSRISHVE